MTGLALKQAGLDRVEDSNSEWLWKMRTWAVMICQSRGSVTTDDLRWHCKAGDQPHSENAWGAVFRGKHWRKAGAITSTWPSNHYREIKVWEWVP